MSIMHANRACRGSVLVKLLIRGRESYYSATGVDALPVRGPLAHGAQQHGMVQPHA